MHSTGQACLYVATVLFVRWTSHALDKAECFSIPRANAERVVIEQHHARRRNNRAADWRVTSGRLVIAYNHPDDDDPVSARIITLWRRS